MDNNQKSKKNFLKVLIPVIACIVVVAVVGALVILLGSKTESSLTTGKLYWNINGAEKINDSGQSDRKANADGYYEITFAVDGEHKKYNVSDKSLVDKIDNMDLMGLAIDKKGVITEVFDTDEVTGGEVVNKWYVQKSEKDSIKVSASLDDDDVSYNLKLSENTGVYDLTNLENVGTKSDVKVGDCVRAFKNKDGKIYYVFLVRGTESDFDGNKVTAYSEYSKKDVVWYEWTETDSLPSTAGHWKLTNDVNLVRENKIQSAIEMIIDLNGHTVNSNKNQRVYNIVHDGCILATEDNSDAKSGILKGHGDPRNGGVIYLQKGNMEIYGGTFDASDIDTESFGATLRLNANTTINMYQGTLIGGISNRSLLGSGDYSGGGGGTVYVSSNAKFIMHDGEIRDGKVKTYKKEDNSYTLGMGGNVYLSTYATFIMENGKISGGVADRFGGNIYVGTYSTFSMSGGIVENGSCQRGGNVYLNTKGLMDLNGGVISKGIASEQGGNIAAWGLTNLKITGGSITDGQAEKRGGNIVSLGEINMSDGVISGGKATSNVGDNANGIGGNIFSTLYTTTENGKKVNYRGILNITGGKVADGESSYSRGGNIYLDNSVDLTLSDCVIENGKCEVSGGNIFAQNKSVVNINKGTIIRNGNAKNTGGNVNVGSGIDVNINGGKILNGTAGVGGGNIYSGGLGNLNIKSGSISNGTAVKRGGNICTFGNVYISGGKIENGKVTSTVGDNDNGIGGNIYISAYDEKKDNKTTTYRSNLVMINGTVTGGTSEYSRGGNIYMAKKVDFELSGKGVIENGSSLKNGGNIFAQEGSVVTLNGGTVQNGVAGENGGNINTGTDIAVNMNSGKVINGKAKKGGNFNCGGRSVLTVKGGQILDGTAEINGGNITAYGNIVMFDGEISGGESTDKENGVGGNIYIISYTSNDKTTISYFKMSGGVVTGGKAPVKGGNAFISSGVVTVNGGEMKNGYSNKGGNIYVSVNAEMTMTSGSLSKGSAQNGGNIYTNGSLTISGGSIKNASAVEKGGNIYSEGDIIMRGGVISGGKSTHTTGSNENGIGGNVFIKDHKLTMTNATISDGESVTSRAGNVYLRNAKLTLGKGSVIKGGKAAQNGGNIMAELNSSIVVNGGTISDGVSGNHGGNIRIGNGTLTINNGSIINGTSKTDGGNVYADTNCTVYFTGGKINITGGKAFENTTSNLYLQSNNRIVISDIEKGSSVGITTKSNGVFSNNSKIEYKDYFFADNNERTIDFSKSDSTLSVVNKEK